MRTTEPAARLRGDSDALVYHTKPPALAQRDTIRQSVIPPRGSTSNCVSKHSRRRRATIDSCFFVESPTSVDTTTTTINTSARRRATTTSVPTTTTSKNTNTINYGGSKTIKPALPPPQHKKTKVKARKTVAFKDPYAPDVIPDRRPARQSYDELLFNVAGLYHTRSYLHDPDYAQDETTADGEPLLVERSLQLMVSEFLYRSAVYLGLHPADDKVWVPGFRENKRFSTNDVMRWRRLAHFDWAAEERQDERQRMQVMRTASAVGLRATVTQWLRRSPTSKSSSFAPPLEELPDALPPLATSLPPLAPTADLTHLVQIANACVSYGGFRFSAKSLRKLCNVPIKGHDP